jgi:hypothetical protein
VPPRVFLLADPGSARGVPAALRRPDLFSVPYWALVMRLPVQVGLLALIAWSTDAFAVKSMRRTGSRAAR